MTQLSRQGYWAATRYTALALGAAGSSAVDGLQTTGYYMSGFEGFVVIGSAVSGGTSAANAFSLSVSQSTATGATGATITGATATNAVTSSSGTAWVGVVDIYRFRRASGEYLSGILSCASSCALLAPIITFRYGAHQMGNSTTPGTVPNSSGGTTEHTDIVGGVQIYAAT